MACLLFNGWYDMVIGFMGCKVIDIGYVNDSCILIVNYDENYFLMGGCIYLLGQQDYVGFLIRLDFDGVFDFIFGDNGYLILNLFFKNEMIIEVIVFVNGKILIVGNVFYGGQSGIGQILFIILQFGLCQMGNWI